MTDQLTDEAVKALLDGTTPGPWRVEILTGSNPNGDEWETDVEISSASGRYIMGHDLGYRDDADAEIKATSHLIAAAPDLARTVIALHAQLADAKAAQAKVVERACLAVSEKADWPEDEHGRTEQPELFARVINTIRALAPAGGLAAVQALRAERDRFEAALGRACLVGGTTYLVERAEKAEAERDRLAAANAALEAQVARLVGALEALRHTVCGETGFASCVRAHSGKAYPWPALDEAEALVNAALAEVQADARREGGE